MPQLVALAVAGAALWAGYRWLARETTRMKDAVMAAEEELRRRAQAGEEQAGAGPAEPDITRAGKAEMKELPKLELDPETGEYRVKKS